MGEKLPILIAALTAQAARALEETARAGGDVWVPLEQKPARDGLHVLEIYTADSDAPIRLLAEPLGMGDERGSALRLHPRPTAEKPSSDRGRTSLAGGRFELLSRIGKGSIGAVYRARHTALKRDVAVKILHEAFQRDAEFCRRFYAEALAMSRLNHANLVNVLDFGQEPDGLLYIAMSYVEGATLRELQQRDRRRFDIPRIVALMLQVCAGLGHAHSRGFIHRDVKPDNLMIVTTEDDDGNRVETIKVLDFGFAVPPSVSGEVAERLAGTPVYMSPEQCLGEELDARSDLYACGVMMYELATGFVPFFANDAVTLRQMHVSSPAPLVSSRRPDIDPRFERIVQRALSKDREERQPSMKELRAELKALLVAEPAPSGPVLQVPTPSSSFEPPPSSRRPAPAPSDEDWLERGSGYDIQASQAPANALADRLAKDASAWLGELARERSARAFLRRLEELDGAARVLAQRADAKTLSRIFVVVTGLADSVRDDAGRSALVATARLFADPDFLFPIATGFLKMAAQEPQREVASKLIAQARTAGAMALYEARTKLPPESHVRVAFVTTMKSLGPAARPVVRAALERLVELVAAGRSRGGTELAEDVLLGVPNGEDELVGRLVLGFARSPVPSVARAAARALPRVWGTRARSVLLQLLTHEDDGVCLAAVVGLHELEAIDLEAVTRMAAQVEAGRMRTPQLQTAFAGALRSATGSARAGALALLARMR